MNETNQSNNRISIMISVPDIARADVMLTEDRIYYRFATDDTIEDGDLPGLKDDYEATVADINKALTQRDNERPIADNRLKLSLFTNTRKTDIGTVTEESLRRLVSRLIDIDEAFGWLGGFL